MDNQKKDYLKFYDSKADASYIARRNKSLVDEVIAETELNSKRKSKEYTDKLGERSHAVASYLKAIEMGKEPGITKYFGKKYLAKLRGQQIVETIKGNKKILGDIGSK